MVNDQNVRDICNSGENHPFAYRLSGRTSVRPVKWGKTCVIEKRIKPPVKYFRLARHQPEGFQDKSTRMWGAKASWSVN